MVNENKGKIYSPVPVYNRKLMRSVLRAQVARKTTGQISKNMAYNFKKIRKGEE